MEFFQFIGTIAPQLAPTLLIAWVFIRIILELLKERREVQEAHRAERKEWREALDQLARETRVDLDQLAKETRASLEHLTKDTRTILEQLAKDYRALVVDVAALGREITAVSRDMANQMHNLKGEITKYMLDEGRRRLGGND